MCQFCGQVNSATGGCKHCWVIPDPLDLSSIVAELSAMWDQAKKPKIPECECGNKENPIGQAHSYWCKRFKQEM